MRGGGEEPNASTIAKLRGPAPNPAPNRGYADQWDPNLLVIHRAKDEECDDEL